MTPEQARATVAALRPAAHRPSFAAPVAQGQPDNRRMLAVIAQMNARARAEAIAISWDEVVTQLNAEAGFTSLNTTEASTLEPMAEAEASDWSVPCADVGAESRAPGSTQNDAAADPHGWFSLVAELNRELGVVPSGDGNF